MIGLILLSALTAGSEDIGTVRFPIEYQSSWADNAEACTPKQADFLTISNNTITYVEGADILVSIVSDEQSTKDDPTRTILADLAYEYAGETSATRRMHFILYGDELLLLDDDQRADHLVRCPVGTIDTRTDRH